MEKSLEYIHQCSNNARPCLIQFKFLHLNYSKERLHRIYPKISPTWGRCLLTEDTTSQLLCPKVETYWINVFKVISKMLHQQGSGMTGGFANVSFLNYLSLLFCHRFLCYRFVRKGVDWDPISCASVWMYVNFVTFVNINVWIKILLHIN